MSIPTLRRLAFLGTSFRQVGFDRLGDLVIPPGREQELRDLAARLDADELVYLATCNRVECYALTRAVHTADDLRRRAIEVFAARGRLLTPGELRCARGAAAAEHLFGMISSLDSLVVGESEVSGQARRALERSLELGLAGHGLRELFERAVTCSRRVRASTQVGALSVSVSTLALRKIKRHFGPAGPRVSVVVGVGPMSLKVARALQGATGEWLFVNRTRSRAEELREQFGGRALSMDEFLAAPPPRIDLLFSATASPRPLISREALARSAASDPRRPLVVCDLGVPPDVDPRVVEVPGVQLVTMSDLEAAARWNHTRLERELIDARRVVRREVRRLVRESRFRDLAEARAQRLLREELSHLSGEHQELLLRYSRGLASRLARQPLRLEKEVA